MVISKAHSSKIASKLTPKDSLTVCVGINVTFKLVIHSLYVIISVNMLRFQNCHMHCIKIITFKTNSFTCEQALDIEKVSTMERLIEPRYKMPEDSIEQGQVTSKDHPNGQSI